MSWSNNTVSFSHLSWFRTCKRAFNLSMAGAPYEANKIITQASAFGHRSEAFWDNVMKDNWFTLPPDKIEENKYDLFKHYSTEEVLKLQEGFDKCFSALKPHMPEDYHLILQKKLSLKTKPFLSYGKMDYFIEQDTPLILDAKSSSSRDKDKKVTAQMMHYSFIHWKNTGKVSNTIAFYSKLGVVDSKMFEEEQLKEYEEKYFFELEDIARTVKFEATPGNHCFLCGYTKDCVAKKHYDLNKKSGIIKNNFKEGEAYGG